MSLMAPMMVYSPDASKWGQDIGEDGQGSSLQTDLLLMEERRKSRDSASFRRRRTPSLDSARPQSVNGSRKNRFLGTRNNKSRHSPGESLDALMSDQERRFSHASRSRAPSVSSSSERASILSADPLLEVVDRQTSNAETTKAKRSLLSRLTKSSIVSQAAPLQGNTAKGEKYATPIGQVGWAVAYPDMRAVRIASGE